MQNSDVKSYPKLISVSEQLNVGILKLSDVEILGYENDPTCKWSDFEMFEYQHAQMYVY